jgi:CRISPR/Cas system-associated exonuclease Cas4 (RecB family)
VQAQPVHTDASPERSVLLQALDQAASHLRTEQMPALIGPHCDRCAFESLCPARGAGAVTA